MASGVKVDKTVVSFLDRMKMEKGDNRVRLATFKIEEGFIKLDKSVTQLDLDKKGQDGFDAFQNELSECHCRYIVYDCHFATKDSPLKEELVFAMWCPDDGVIKDRMVFASSKDSFKKMLKGIKHSLQINDKTSCNDRAAFADELANNVTGQIKAIEGVDI